MKSASHLSSNSSTFESNININIGKDHTDHEAQLSVTGTKHEDSTAAAAASTIITVFKCMEVKVQRQKEEYTSLQAENESQKRQITELETENDWLHGQLTLQNAEASELRDENTALRDQIRYLQEEATQNTVNTSRSFLRPSLLIEAASESESESSSVDDEIVCLSYQSSDSDLRVYYDNIHIFDDTNPA